MSLFSFHGSCKPKLVIRSDLFLVVVRAGINQEKNTQQGSFIIKETRTIKLSRGANTFSSIGLKRIPPNRAVYCNLGV